MLIKKPLKKPSNKISKKTELKSQALDNKEQLIENSEEVMENNKLINEIEEVMEDLEHNLELLEDAITDDNNQENDDFEPIINSFYDSINIPYCKRCGEKEMVNSIGEKICAIAYEKCTFIENTF